MAERRLAHFPTWLLLIAALPAQVIPVSGSGAALANAVAAAPSGATIVVLTTGGYDGFTVVDKDLTIIAPARATIVGNLEATAGTTPRTLRLVKLDLIPVSSGTVPGIVRVADNLHMVECTCRGLQVGGSITSTSRCWVERSTVYGSFAENTVYGNAALIDCSITGVPVYSTWYGGWVAQRGLWVFGSLRAERTQFTSSTGASPFSSIAALELWGPGTLANCSLNAGNPGHYGLLAQFSPVTLWSTSISGSILAAATTRLLATAQWTQRNWSVGGTSQVTFHEAPNTIAAMVVSLGIAPWAAPFAAESLWVGATPDWGVWAVGVSDAQGNFAATAAIPNVPALLYAEAWLTGVFFDPFPLRTTVPIGGTIQ